MFEVVFLPFFIRLVWLYGLSISLCCRFFDSVGIFYFWYYYFLSRIRCIYFLSFGSKYYYCSSHFYFLLVRS